MTTEFVFLVEERSMQVALTALLPKIGLDPGQTRIIPHQGASDLEKSLPRKLKAWRNPGALFFVLRDNDGGDCNERKLRLAQICNDSGRSGQATVRIVCQELEAWFLGEPEAIARSGLIDQKTAAKWHRQQRFENPDTLAKPSELLRKQINGYTKIAGAKAIAAQLDPRCNRSRSFRVFVESVQAARHRPS